MTSAVASSPTLADRISDLLEAMSLEEMLGQVVRAETSAVTPADVSKFHLGSILNGVVIATAKHWLGDGGTEGGIDQDDKLGDDLPERDAAAVGKRTEGDDLEIYFGQAVRPFKGFVGDSGGWQVPLQAGVTRSNQGVLTVTPVALRVQEDALRVQWSGKGEGQFYFQTSEPLDLRALAKKDAALELLIRVETMPEKAVTLRMDCQYPCASSADISKLLQALPVDEWLRLTIDLRCFSKKGLKLEKIDTPFLLLTDGPLAVSVADIGIKAGKGKNAAIACR